MERKQKLLERLRKSIDLSQKEVASRIGVSRPTYVLIESGMKELTLSQAKILSDMYSVPVEAIHVGFLEKNSSLEKNIVITQLPTKHGTFSFGV